MYIIRSTSAQRPALESARSACVVVGEDLGVVPDEVRRAMAQFGLYHYKVLLFEKDSGRYRRPEDFVTARSRPSPPMICRRCAASGKAATSICGET